MYTPLLPFIYMYMAFCVPLEWLILIIRRIRCFALAILTRSVDDGHYLMMSSCEYGWYIMVYGSMTLNDYKAGRNGACYSTGSIRRYILKGPSKVLTNKYSCVYFEIYKKTRGPSSIYFKIQIFSLILQFFEPSVMIN